MDLSSYVSTQLKDIMSSNTHFLEETKVINTKIDSLKKAILEDNDSYGLTNRDRVFDLRKASTVFFMLREEINYNLRRISELYTLAKVMKIDVGLPIIDLEVIETNRELTQPKLVFRDGKVIFSEEAYESQIEEQLQSSDLEIKKIVDTIKDGKDKG